MIERAFARAYGARDLGGMAGLLAPDAVAELVGSGFPPETGAGAIREGSLAHLLEGEDLTADVVTVEGASYVAFLDEDGGLDSLAALAVQGGLVVGLRYHTRWHDEAFVARAAAALGLAD